MATTDLFYSRLDDLYDQWQKLTPDSAEADFEKFASHFNKDGTAWLKSMREVAEPSVGREGIIQGIKDAVKDSQLTGRRVVARSATPDGRKVFVEHSNHLTVLGKSIDPFPETTVVEFDSEGLIWDFKNYSCRSPVVTIIQEVTGEGPYERHDDSHCG
jgi:hypothetical protein